MLSHLAYLTRSCRRFKQSEAVDRTALIELVDLGRLAASAANRQPLKYRLTTEEAECASVFPNLAWAGYLQDWPGPADGERPTGYITILGDTEVARDFGVDAGLAAQNILLGATEKQLGACMLGAIDRPGLRGTLDLPDRYEILFVIALGHPAERIVLEEAKPDQSIRYWRDDDGVHHVPKRRLDDIIVG